MTPLPPTLHADGSGPRDFRPAAPARRGRRRRARRWWPAGLLLAVAILGIAYGPSAWRRHQLLKLQEACLSAELPQDRPMWVADPAEAAALVAARPGEYVLDRQGWAVRVDPRWVALTAEPGVGPRPGVPAWFLLATTYCHERYTPDGRRRLVVVEDSPNVTVVEPAGWLGAGPRVVWREVITWDAASEAALAAARGSFGPSRLGAGATDPADRSRFTVPFVLGGVAGTFEYRLGDNDRVTIRVLDPDGFMARARAALAAQERAAARPASAPAAPEGK